MTNTLVDSKGTTLERNMKVITAEGLKAHVTRLDAKSGRAVVIFEEVDGVVPINPTMRKTTKLTVRKVAGKILFVKEAAKAAKAKPEPKTAPEPAKAKVKAPAKPKPAKPEPGAELVITDEELVEPTAEQLEEIANLDLDALIADLPGDAFQV